jgi:tetratricopeptide (TPR) repeat protein
VDVVLFRNVAIYLEKSVIEKIYREFANVLRDGGCLMVAPADPRPSVSLFTRCDLTDSSVYLVRRPTIQPVKLQPRARKNGRTGAPMAHSGSTARSEGEVPRLPSKISVLKTAEQYSNRGEADKALDMIERIIAVYPAAKEGYLLRGQIHLANQRVENAVADLRRTLFIDSEDKIARFWYAYALQKAGLKSRAEKNLEILTGQLRSISAETVLEDGDTSAGELLQTVKQMKASQE